MLDNKKKIIISVILLIILAIGFVIYILAGNSNDYSTLDLENDALVDSGKNVENEQENSMQSADNTNVTDDGNDIDNTNQVTEEVVEIAVHITGEVKKQGLIYLKEGSRVADAIEKAGGETKNADLSQINLAYVLQDGQKIYVPNKNEKISQYITGNSGNNDTEENNTSDLSKEDSKVNINTANQSELDSLPGIGPSIAQKIIDYREENGNFKTIEELQNVKGIGDAKYEEIKDRVTV